MTVEQLIELLEDFGGHLAVFVEDKTDRRWSPEFVESTDEDGVPCIVLRAIGDRISQ
jgi:hypothetical protein